MTRAKRCGRCEMRRKIAGADPTGFGDDLCQECFDDEAVHAAEQLADRLREILETASPDLRSEIRHPFDEVLHD